MKSAANYSFCHSMQSDATKLKTPRVGRFLLFNAGGNDITVCAGLVPANIATDMFTNAVHPFVVRGLLRGVHIRILNVACRAIQQERTRRTNSHRTNG